MTCEETIFVLLVIIDQSTDQKMRDLLFCFTERIGYVLGLVFCIIKPSLSFFGQLVIVVKVFVRKKR